MTNPWVNTVESPAAALLSGETANTGVCSYYGILLSPRSLPKKGDALLLGVAHPPPPTGVICCSHLGLLVLMSVWILSLKHSKVTLADLREIEFI